MLPLKHIKPFLSVARHVSLARASEEMHRAASALSRSVQELEAALRTELFERSRKRWVLAAPGRILQERAGEALDLLEQAQHELCLLYPDQVARIRKAPFFSLSVHERRLDLLLAFDERKPIRVVAAAIGISQPAASMGLHELESCVGVPLFDRNQAGVALAPAGALLVSHVKRAQAQLRLACAEIDAQQGLLTGQVVVGALPFCRSYILPRAAADLLATHEWLSVRTVEAPLPHLLDGLRLGEIDFLVGAIPALVLEGDLVQEQLLQQEMRIVLRAGHPLARGEAPDWERLLQQSWVLPPRASPTRDAFEAMLAHRGLAGPRVAVESSDLSVIRGMLQASDMISAASPQLFQYELESCVLATLSVDLPGTGRSIGIVRRTEQHSSPAARLLMRLVREVAQA